jgi:hypothetical protein
LVLEVSKRCRARARGAASVGVGIGVGIPDRFRLRGPPPVPRSSYSGLAPTRPRPLLAATAAHAAAAGGSSQRFTHSHGCSKPRVPLSLMAPQERGQARDTVPGRGFCSAAHCSGCVWSSAASASLKAAHQVCGTPRSCRPAVALRAYASDLSPHASAAPALT